MKILSLILLCVSARAQYAPSASGSTTAAGEINAKMAFAVASSAPATCVQGKEVYLNSSNGKWFLCGATNTWLEIVATTDARLSDSRAPSGSASGDLGSTFPGPTVVKVNGASVPASSKLAGTNGSSQIVAATASDASAVQYVAGGGTAQAQTATLAPAITALTIGLEVRWLPAAANTSAAPTLAVNGLTAKPITKNGTAAVVANDLTTTAIARAIYDGTQFQLQNPQTAALPAAASFGAVTDASPIAWNLASGTQVNGIVTLAHGVGTRALNVSNLVNGGIYMLEVLQDSTGGAALTGGTGCTWLIPGGTGGGAFPISTTANIRNTVTFIYDGTNCLVQQSAFIAM